MKKILIGAAGLALLGAMVVPVFAATGVVGNALSHYGAPAVAPFKAPTYQVSYVDPFFGPVECTGMHVSTGPTSAITSGYDTFTCVSTVGQLGGGVTGGEVLTLGNPFSGWISDYYGQQGKTVYASAFNGVVWPDGKTYTATAVYPTMPISKIQGD